MFTKCVFEDMVGESVNDVKVLTICHLIKIADFSVKHRECLFGPNSSFSTGML